MKAFKVCLMAVLAALLVAVFACDDPKVDKDTEKSTDDGGDNSDIVLITSDCDPAKLCSALPEAKDCVATFDLGTTQAGYVGIMNSGLYDANSEYNTDYPWVGWYSYNDYSWQNGPDATMKPEKNNDGSEPAEKVDSCAGAIEGKKDYTLHAYGDGWVTWGVGLGLDWSGENNPACYNEDGTEKPDSIACWAAYLADDRIKEAEIRELPECPTDEAVECAMQSKRMKIPRDLSEYKGLGFWIATTPNNEARVIQVHFPIPDTTRFLGACSDETGEDGTKCYNDFMDNINLSDTDVGKWVYKEVLFENLAQSPDWGLQLDTKDFPPTQSVGLKFQFGWETSIGPVAFDFYLDDIHLIRK